MIYVGLCYLDGRNVDQDIAVGITWLERAADLKDTEAIAQLAMLYEMGDCLPVDCARARAYYAALEEDEDFTGPYMLALAYSFGSDCMPRDEAAAFRYFARAAKAGHLVSEFRLAVLMRSGRYGMRNWLLGWLLPIRAYVKVLPIIFSGRYDRRLWDAERWLPKRGMWARLRKGTRFE